MRQQLISADPNDSIHQITNLLKLYQKPDAWPQRLLVPDGKRMTFIRISDIHYIEALENYISIVTSDQSYMLLKTMNEIEKQMDPAHFFRIHRSYLVNVNEVSSIELWEKGSHLIKLNSGQNLPLSRRRVKKFKERFGI